VVLEVLNLLEVKEAVVMLQPELLLRAVLVILVQTEVLEVLVDFWEEQMEELEIVIQQKQEAVVEVFDRLRPVRGYDHGYKTNKLYEVGERVIKEYAVTQAWGRGKFRLAYGRTGIEQLVRCLDNVMHLLDGKGPVHSHNGPLVDALNSHENFGHVETEYFEAKCFKKGTLHLRFKRLDLLRELNLRGSGMAAELPGMGRNSTR
jgi:hypothetical protein